MADQAEQAMRGLLRTLGDKVPQGVAGLTAARAAAAWRWNTRGYAQDVGDIINNALFPTTLDDIVSVTGIELYSLCEHHLLPFFGVCHVGYWPDGKVIGLSKLPRLVEAFASRLQLQERLTEEIADAVERVTGAKGVGVIVQARHLCMMMRGVRTQGAQIKTLAMRGLFRADMAARAALLSRLET
jgi:GTP cyclohydrolase I